MSFYQVKKYERGVTRVLASRLWEFSSILGVPVACFFEGAGGRSKPKDQLLTKRETFGLVRYFSACSDDVQDRLLALFQALAESDGKK